MSAIRTIAKACAVLVWGRDLKPRRILRGLASGYRIWASPGDNLGYLLGTDEPHLQRVIRKYVGAGDTVYDIAANVSYVSLSLPRQVRTAGHVIAFEPVPRSIESF